MPKWTGSFALSRNAWHRAIPLEIVSPIPSSVIYYWRRTHSSFQSRRTQVRQPWACKRACLAVAPAPFVTWVYVIYHVGGPRGQIRVFLEHVHSLTSNSGLSRAEAVQTSSKQRPQRPSIKLTNHTAATKKHDKPETLHSQSHITTARIHRQPENQEHRATTHQ